MRAVLLERVRPLAEAFAEDLVELLAADVERRIEQLGEAFAVASSAFAAELAGDQDARDAGSPPLVVTVPEPAVVAKQGSTSSPAIPLAIASSPHGRGLAGQGSPAPSSSRRKPSTCSKCGAIGFTAQACGKSHNVSTSPATGSNNLARSSSLSPATPSISSPPPISSDRAGRFAAIEQSAQRRDAAKRSRGERAASFVRRGGGSTRGVRGPVLSDGAPEGGAVEPALPEPVASFDL